jgi:hypothetical protein
MKDFLKNNLCDFKILNRSHLLDDDNKNINVLVSSFLKKNTSGKKYLTYLKDLQKILDFVETLTTPANKLDNKLDNNTTIDGDNSAADYGIIFVLFINQNVRDDTTIMSMIEKSRNTVPILFKCTRYTKECYNYDVFEKLIKFFPLFDFQNNPFNIITCVNISVDNELSDDDYIILKSMLTNKIKGFTSPGNIAKLIYNNELPRINSNIICNNDAKYNHLLLTNFVRDSHFDKELSCRNITSSNIDDSFLNDILVPELKDYKIIIDYQFTYFLYYSRNRIFHKDNIDNTSDILSMIIGDSLSNQSVRPLSLQESFRDNPTSIVANIGTDIATGVGIGINDIVSASAPDDDYAPTIMDVFDKIKFIDDNIYRSREKNKINNELSKRFALVINHLVKKKKHWLEKNVQIFLNKYLKNIISANVVVGVNYKTGITSINIFDGVYDTDYVLPGFIKDSKLDSVMVSLDDIDEEE